MSDTIDPVSVGDEWESLNALSGIPAGTQIKIQNVGTTAAFIRISATQPTEYNGEGCYSQKFYGVSSGENEVWAKTQANGSSALLSVQED
jgi:hypothetical protein